MHDWIAMAINVAYIIFSFYLLNKLRLSNVFPLGSWTHALAVIFLVSVFFQIGLMLFDIPIGFFGMNNPHTIGSLKEKWWAAPGLGLSGLSFALSCRTALLSFRSKNFKPKELWQLSLSSFLLGLLIVCLLLAVGIKSDTMAPEDQEFIIDYWWGFGLFFGFLHLVCLFIIKGVLYLRSLNE
jgi:ABC-type Fe3+ transport system permease subunit